MNLSLIIPLTDVHVVFIFVLGLHLFIDQSLQLEILGQYLISCHQNLHILVLHLCPHQCNVGTSFFGKY
jgi:hypothetical protein